MKLEELIALACRTAERAVTDNKGRLEFVFDDAGLERFAEVVAAAELLSVKLTVAPEPEPEPVAFYNFQLHKMRWAKPTVYAEIVAVDVPELPLYAAPPSRKE